MSCISLIIGKPHTGGVSVTDPVVGNVSVDAKPTGWFDIDVLNRTPSITASKVGDVRLGIYLICRVGKDKYLRVTPTETMWITVDSSIDYNILSNTDWIVQ